MISIVTITYNNYDELVATVESVANVEGKQLIVVNGGSCLKTKAYLENSMVVSDFVSEPDQGISDAFNKGLKLAKHEFVTFLNSGDRYQGSNYYLRAVELLQESYKTSFVHGDMNLEDRFAGRILVRPAQGALSTEQPYLFPTMVFRKSVFKDLGSFSLQFRIAMDFEFIVRLKKAGLIGIYLQGIPAVVMDGLGISNKSEIKGIKECYRALEGHGLLDAKSEFDFQKRIWRVRLKNVLEKFGFGFLISLFKKQKHRV